MKKLEEPPHWTQKVDLFIFFFYTIVVIFFFSEGDRTYKMQQTDPSKGHCR